VTRPRNISLVVSLNCNRPVRNELKHNYSLSLIIVVTQVAGNIAYAQLS